MRQDDVIVGEGITERTRQRLSLDPDVAQDAADLVAVFERMAARAMQAWGGQQTIVGAIRQDAAHLRAEDACRAACNDAYIGSDEYQARYQERSTLAWYVREMDANATMVELAMAGGRPWEAVSWAMQLAEALAEARLRYQWNEAAVVGAKQLGHAADGRAKWRRQPAVIRYCRVTELLLTGSTLRSAIRKAAAEFKVAYSTISRDYYHIKRSQPVD